MKQLVDYVWGYLREDFHPGYYATIGLFLVAAFTLNFRSNFKLEILNPATRDPSGILYSCLFYGCAYYFAALAWAFFHRDHHLLRSRPFWGISAFVIGALALGSYAMSLPGALVDAIEVPEPARHWVLRCVWNFDRMITLAIPIVLFRRCVDRQPGAFYGLVWRDIDWRPYVSMLLVMVPLIAWASFRPAFLATYPGYRAGEVEAYFSLSRSTTFGVYESTYALRYVAIELFFRGLLVLGLEKHLGRAVLMPMVTVYAFWHFGKPIPEAIGSVFAGYILGVLALRTRSIIGGIVVHVSVALGMDLAAYLQTYVFAR